ncbi:AAA family ATPase [Candidatus Roizmanbacteria bacterium]|nr:MAG: AAA family ATPase [Candidatus Roizmanbacteria bacterium]
MDNQAALSEITKLKTKLQSVQLPANLQQKALEQIERINLSLKFGGNLAHLDIIEKYIDWITALPWYAETKDVVDIAKAKASLDKNHYGLDRVKLRILEYLSIYKLQKEKLNASTIHTRPLFFVGLAGTGKTTFAISIAEALGRRLVRIPFGGLASARDLRGQSKISPESEPGKIIESLREVQVRNPVILLDELDRITPDARAEVMGVLLELLDPNQNQHFVDYFLDFPFDLSNVLFVATANNTNNIAPPVLDRLELIQMPSYTDDEKIEIGKTYILPKYMKAAGVEPNQLTIDDALWPDIVRPLGFEPGIRSLERLIETIVRKVAYKLVSGEGNNFYINANNIREFK